MINFTVGPVQSHEYVLDIGKESTPYFRTPEFSSIMFENEELIKKYANAPLNSRAMFITGSGTAAMEATVINTLSKDDKVLIVCGGSFGERFVQICNIHNIPNYPIMIEPGKTLLKETLDKIDGSQYTAFLVNIGETSTGVLYNIGLISEFCKHNDLFLIVDAISAFIADDIDMNRDGIDVMITGSQKALAVPPGISIIIANGRAIDRINASEPCTLYFDLRNTIKNADRGQTPFTPAVTILLQINRRLREIESMGGVNIERNKIIAQAMDFRDKMAVLPFEIFADTPSNAVTSIVTKSLSAKGICDVLRDKHDIWVCPNGGELEETVFRVGHIGNLCKEDNTKLIQALNDVLNEM